MHDRSVSRSFAALCAVSLCAVLPTQGTATNVSSLDALRGAVAAAKPGDRIVVADGVYTCDAPIVITQQGNKGAPIVITAEHVGGVELGGAAGFRFERPAAYVVLRGFKFTHRTGTVVLPAGTQHCRVTRNVFELQVMGKASYLIVSGDDHEIDHNSFGNKSSEGQMLQVEGPPMPAMAQRTWIHHNYFHDFANSHRNNSSALHIGHSSRSMTPAHSLVEYNLFIRTRGENEGAICNKSSDNIYRYNTFGEGCTELSLRHGNRCHVYGNFFIGTRGGLRFYGDDHRIFSNYFQSNNPAVQIGNGDGEVAEGSKLTCHDRPDRVQFVFNTLVDNTEDVIMSRRSRGLGATQLVFANNLIQGGRRAVSIQGPLRDPAWQGNLLWNNDGGAGDLPPEGFIPQNPKLKQAAGGIFHLAEDSPAIGRAAGAFPDVVVDMDGQKRRAPLDIGADQFSNAAAMNGILTPGDVGPDAP